MPVAFDFSQQGHGRVSSLIISLWNFKKPLDIFSPQIERKRSKEYLVIIQAVKESYKRFSCLEFILERSKHREAGLKHKQDASKGVSVECANS